jgi:hypothetical protein
VFVFYNNDFTIFVDPNNRKRSPKVDTNSFCKKQNVQGKFTKISIHRLLVILPLNPRAAKPAHIARQIQSLQKLLKANRDVSYPQPAQSTRLSNPLPFVNSTLSNSITGTGIQFLERERPCEI